MTSSGITALLWPLGKTALSIFKIPDADETSTCLISKQSNLAQLIMKASLIIWDEAQMTHHYTLEPFEHSLHDNFNRNLAFGGKVIIFWGDFRQVLPVVTKGSSVDIVASSISTASFWCYYNVQHLKITHAPHPFKFKLWGSWALVKFSRMDVKC